MIRPSLRQQSAFFLFLLVLQCVARADSPDVIVHHGKVVTVNEGFEIVEAMAIRGDRIQAVGTNDEILKLAGPDT